MVMLRYGLWYKCLVKCRLAAHPSAELLQFDFKKALLRALGGGLSGAAGTNILYVG